MPKGQGTTRNAAKKSPMTAQSLKTVMFYVESYVSVNEGRANAARTEDDRSLTTLWRAVTNAFRA